MSTTNHQLFPTTAIDAEYVLTMTEEGEANELKTPALELCRYTLMADSLVPETFVQRVMDELTNHQFDYGFVLRKEDIFTHEFLASLDDQEHTVLMSVVLLLVARNALELNIWADKGTESFNAKG
jgi:hypothetical protein